MNCHVELYNTANVFHTPPPSFLETQIISPFLYSRISANPDKVKGHSTNDEILVKGFRTICIIKWLEFLYFKMNSLFCRFVVTLEDFLKQWFQWFQSKKVKKDNIISKWVQNFITHKIVFFLYLKEWFFFYSGVLSLGTRSRLLLWSGLIKDISK